MSLTLNSGLKNAIFQAVSVQNLQVSQSYSGIVLGNGAQGISSKLYELFLQDYVLLFETILKQGIYTLKIAAWCDVGTIGNIKVYDYTAASEILNFNVINTNKQIIIQSTGAYVFTDANNNIVEIFAKRLTGSGNMYISSVKIE